MAGDVETQDLLLPLEPIVERPLRLLGEIVGEIFWLRGASTEETRLPARRLVAQPRRRGDDALGGRRERRAVLAE